MTCYLYVLAIFGMTLSPCIQGQGNVGQEKGSGVGIGKFT